MVYLLALLSYLASSKNVSVRPPVRPGYDDNYRSRSYRFVERQKVACVSDEEEISATVTTAVYRKVVGVKTCHSTTTFACYGTNFTFTLQCDLIFFQCVLFVIKTLVPDTLIATVVSLPEVPTGSTIPQPEI